MPNLGSLRGLRASDRSKEEQQAINAQMGYKDNQEVNTISIKPSNPTPISQPQVDTASASILNNALHYQKHLDNQYLEALAEQNQRYNVGSNSVNSSANDYLDSIANNVSSYYKKYKGTDKLPIDDDTKKKLAAEYDARKQTYGEDNANIWLDNQFKDIVGNNQSWLEQGLHAISHLIPAIEGGAIQTYGMLHGAVNHVLGSEGYNENPDLNWFDSFINDVIDNPVTRYGRDIEMSGATHLQDIFNFIGLSDQTANERIAATKATATKYNPEGIGADTIVTTQDQDDAWFSTATPWQALQAGGFTALSMLTGAAEAKAAGWLFNGLAKGANLLNKTGKIIRTEEGLRRTLEGLKRAQNVTDMFIIPGTVGSVEGAIEGLNTKIEVERSGVEQLDNYYKEKVGEEATALFNSDELNPLIEINTDRGKVIRRKYVTPDEAFKEVWDKYKDEYTDARRQIDWASSKAGIHNFWTNSMINGAINQTLKAGIMAPRVQETLRNSKLFGWAYKNPRFNVDENYVATPKISKASAVGRLLKEPLGEGTEEYLQSLSSDVFSEAAENNINEFIKNRFEGDGTAKIAESFGSDYAAALTALTNSVTNKESIQSAILGAVSSTMGTVGGVGRGYHRDENGNLVRNSMLDIRNFTRGLNSEGNQESWIDYARRVTPWRSGAINAYFDRKQEIEDANATAATLTGWLKVPENRAKWDGLQGTANWLTQLENAAESNDQFSYRKAQMGKAINDIFMLKKLEGTDFYESVMADLQRASSGEISQEEVQKLKQNGGEDYQNVSNEEIVEKIQSNANRMLGLMSQVETESKNFDRLLGRIDEDTKQSLIYGKIMEQDFRERRDQLQEEIDTIKSRIKNSKGSSGMSLNDEQTKLLMRHGSLAQTLRDMESAQKELEKAQKKVEELKAIDPSKMSDKQKVELILNRHTVKEKEAELSEYDALYEKDSKGRKTDQIDSRLSSMVLNEEDIMSLDPITRAKVMTNGAARLYNATHQDRQKVDQLNLEIDELNHQIDALEVQKKGWMTNDGRVKKHHNKQVQRNNQKIEELNKQKTAKLRALDAEQGRLNTKPIYSAAQQDVIDNLVQQGIAQDADFLDKLVDIGRLERGIKDYHTQYQAILSDPKAFQNYVQRAKYNAQRDLTRRRAERIASIQNFQEFSQELDRLTANASQQEMNEIMAVMRQENEKQKKQVPEGEETPKTNFDRYTENLQKQGDLIRQFAKNPNLTANDQSLLVDAMRYLSGKGIDVTDREVAVEALIERDEQGNQGGKFRQFVEAQNDMRLPQQETFMPVFTTIGQVVSQYVDLINGQQTDAVNKGNLQPTIQPAQPSSAQPTVQPAASPSPNPDNQQQSAPSIFDIAGGSTPESGHFVDNDGTVATDTQTQAVQQRQQQSQQPEPKTPIEQAFQKVTSPEIAQMLNVANDIIENANISNEAKSLARQYLMDLAVDDNVHYSTVDELLTDFQGQIDRLRNMSNQQEENNRFGEAAGVLQQIHGSLYAKKIRGRGRSAPMPSTRPINPRAAVIHSANIAYIESMNPDAWAVRFTNDHAIDEWNRDHQIDRKEPIYFITDSEWTAETTSQMNNTAGGKRYDTLSDMPIVAAVKVETPQNTANTTAIEVNGQWYQPICIMPGSKAKSVSGAAMTEEIRKLASKEQGRHLVTANGLPNGDPLITHVYGVNYLEAHHPDANTQNQRQNTAENNSDIIDGVLRTLPRDSEDRLRVMTKQEMLADPEYQEARSKFLDGLQWNGEGTGAYENQLTFTPDNHRQGEKGNPMLVFTKPMAETTARNSDQTLGEVLSNGTPDQVVTFNSRTERLFNEIIRPLFQYLPMKDKSGDRSAKLITQQDVTANPNVFQEEADRLTKLLNGFDGSEGSRGIRGISDFIYINPKSGWSIKVTTPESLQTIGDVANSETVYKIFFINNDPDLVPIELGEIRMNATSANSPDNNNNATQFLRNLMWDSQTGQIRDFINWQVPKADAQNLRNPDKARSGQARRNYAAIVDDGILTLAGSSLVYDVDGVKLQAPVTRDDQGHTRIVHPVDKVVNANNAQPAAPQNVTPQGDGAVIAGDGSQVLADSGADLGSTNNTPIPPSPPQDSMNLRKAKEITRRIIEDSKQFTLSEDEVYYYITDNITGQETRYLRVTTVIDADENVPQWDPTVAQIVDKLKERHSIPELTRNQLNSFKDINQMSKALNIPVSEIRRAIAELRTVYKKEKYGVWSVPSTSIGNTCDAITRDFLAGHLKDSYPNITKAAQDLFVQQLRVFKNDLESKGIHIVSEGVVAHGKITMTDSEGNVHDANVAGTLDLFGYDDNGNFYILDMKTTRDHSTGKLIKEKAKWSRQISMYADLLKQSYGIQIAPENLRIIPIDVNYPTPMGKKTDNLDPAGPQYSETSEGQLQTTYRGEKEPSNFDGSNPKMRGVELSQQFQPGYTPFNINWDNLSSEDQDIASALITQTVNSQSQDNIESPSSAHIETPQNNRPSFVDTGDVDFGNDNQEAGSSPAPIVPNGQAEILPQWRKLNSAIKGFLAENYGIEGLNDYNEMLNDTALAEGIAHDLKCHGLM